MTVRKMRAGQAGAEAEAAEALVLGEQVTERGAERPGEDVGDPEGQRRCSRRVGGPAR